MLPLDPCHDAGRPAGVAGAPDVVGSRRPPESGGGRRPAGIPGSGLPGPWPVGQYAAALRGRLRGFARVQVFGEVVGVKPGRARVWFELRDEGGALPCAMWRSDWDALGDGAPVDGARVVAAAAATSIPARARPRRPSPSP